MISSSSKGKPTFYKMDERKKANILQDVEFFMLGLLYVTSPNLDVMKYPLS